MHSGTDVGEVEVEYITVDSAVACVADSQPAVPLNFNLMSSVFDKPQSVECIDSSEHFCI